MKIFGANFSLSSSYLRALMISMPLLAGCESEIVSINLPDAAAAGEPFEVSVEHVFTEDMDSFGDDNGSLLFAAMVPEDWQAQSATYEGTLGGGAISLPVTISDAPPQSSQEIINYTYECSASVTLREGAASNSPLIATLFSSFDVESFIPRSADPFSLAPYAGSTVYVVMESASCYDRPNGVVVDNLVLNAGISGNLLSNASFESGLTDWIPDANISCVSETLESGEATTGAGEWVVPAPSDGTYLYASDTEAPGQCVLSQSVSIPGAAGAATFTGTVGANSDFAPPGVSEDDEPITESEALFIALMDTSPVVAPEGLQLIWFSANDLPSLSFVEGDSGTILIEFVAPEGDGGTVSVQFFHGYYSEVNNTQQDAGKAAALLATNSRSSATGGWPGVSSSAIPSLEAVTPGYIGAAFWFFDALAQPGPGGVPPQSQTTTMTILPAAAPTTVEPVPVMGGVMLFILSLGVAVVGLSRRYRVRK